VGRDRRDDYPRGEYARAAWFARIGLTLFAIAFFLLIVPWPVPPLTRVIIRYLYHNCFGATILCAVPMSEIFFSVYFTLLALTYTVLLFAYLVLRCSRSFRPGNEATHITQN
jgi:hypothetical protein